MSDFLALLESVLPNPESDIPACMRHFSEIELPRRTHLLRAGEIAKNLYLVKDGCLRLYHVQDGREITFQFFFENEAVASIESFRSGKPGIVNIESIEPSRILVLSKKDVNTLFAQFPALKDVMLEMAMMRFEHYTKLFLSLIAAPPVERYRNLLKNEPKIIQRVPQHYIASYLGITPVSLSRIRNRIQQ